MISEKHRSNRNNTQAISGTIHGETAVASPIPVKLYLLHVPLPLRWDSNPRFVSKTWCFAGKKAKWFGERYKVFGTDAMYQ